MNGFFFVDKDQGKTSFDVVKEIRELTGVKKVGHSGTLDPLATGLLLVAVGEATKLLEYLIGCDKEYEVLARFGVVSDTFDADGEMREVGEIPELPRSEVLQKIAECFIGDIFQTPPKYSALKVSGRRACDIIRSGGEVELESRQINVSVFEIIDWDWPVVRFRVACSSGTYVRSLIHDLGQSLGTGACVEELRRTKVGEFSLADVSSKIMPIEDLGRRHFSCIDLSDQEFNGLSDGRSYLNIKIERGAIYLAFYKEKVVGILSGVSGGKMKFRKRIFPALD